MLGPEALVAIEPLHRFLHGRGRELAGDLASGFFARDQAGIREHIEMLHDRGQRHLEWPREFTDGHAVLLVKTRQQGAPRRVGKSAEGAVQDRILGVLILNHRVKYWALIRMSQGAGIGKSRAAPPLFRKL